MNGKSPLRFRPCLRSCGKIFHVYCIVRATQYLGSNTNNDWQQYSRTFSFFEVSCETAVSINLSRTEGPWKWLQQSRPFYRKKVTQDNWTEVPLQTKWSCGASHNITTYRRDLSDDNVFCEWVACSGYSGIIQQYGGVLSDVHFRQEVGLSSECTPPGTCR